MNLHWNNTNCEQQGRDGCPSAARPVDLVHLERQTMGNRSLEHEVLALFHSRSELYLQRLKDADEDKAWSDAAHAIKGSARGIGAWRVANSAQAAEALCGEDRAARCRAALNDLEQVIGEANSYIESLLSGTGQSPSPDSVS